MKIISMITLEVTLKHACALTYIDIHTDTSGIIIYDIPFNGKY